MKAEAKGSLPYRDTDTLCSPFKFPLTSTLVQEHVYLRRDRGEKRICTEARLFFAREDQ